MLLKDPFFANDVNLMASKWDVSPSMKNHKTLK
jgi:hypothetical protein